MRLPRHVTEASGPCRVDGASAGTTRFLTGEPYSASARDFAFDPCPIRYPPGVPTLLLPEGGVNINLNYITPLLKRIVTASGNGTVRIWRADGAGAPLVLGVSDSRINTVAFSSDGERILSVSDDHTVRVWTDLEPLRGVADRRLWTATTYCMPVDRRVELLGVPEAKAREDREDCLRRVEQARAAAPEP